MVVALILESFLTMFVVDLSLLIILEHIISVVDVMELKHCVLIVRVLVWVVLHSQLAIGLLYLAGTGIMTHAKYLIEITSVEDKY